MAFRQSMLLSEPFMTEDAVLVCVWHMTLGKKQSFLYSYEKCTQIYHWIGSLSPEPEFFELLYTNRVVDPNDSLTTAERTVLSVHEVSESNLTINIIKNRVLNVSKDRDLIEQNGKSIPLRSQKIYQGQIGQNIYVEFYGEVGVDQVGSKREFFTGKS